MQWEGKGNSCSCKPWQVANKAVRDSASPVFTFAPQLVIIEKRSAKTVAYFSVLTLFTPFVLLTSIGIELGTQLKYLQLQES